MAITPLPITNGFYESESLPLSAQECTNWYANIPQSPALATESLFRTPGAKQLATASAIGLANRGGWVFNGKPYFVNAGMLYRLNEVGTTYELESLGEITGSGRVSFADNGTQLCILNPGGDGYIFTDTPDTLTKITSTNFTANGQPQYVVFIDGYFVFTTDSKKFITSNLNDGLSYTATDFGTAEANPDDTVAPFVFNNQLFIMGAITGEAFTNVGGAGFPFRRSGLFLTKGVFAPLSIIEASNTFMWIGGGKNESPAIWQFAGNTSEKVSTTAIDNVLQDLTEAELSQVFAWSYSEKGAYFVGFSLPSTSFVIDTVTGRWHERKSTYTDFGGNKQNVRFRANCVLNAYSKILIGDSVDGRIGELSQDYLDEYGNTISRIVSTQPFQNNMQAFTIPMLELTVESGAGNDDIEDPKITMDISVDGGKTYKDARPRSIGKRGDYRRRAIWRRNGRVSRLAVVRFTMTDAVETSILQLTADMRAAK